MEGFEYSVQRGGTRVQFRGRLPGLAGRGVSKTMEAKIRQEVSLVRDRLVQRARGIYRGVQDYTGRFAVGKSQIAIWLTANDQKFFYQEFDTGLHWPPFGKDTPFGQWARDRGLNPFSLAWHMAPPNVGIRWHITDPRTGHPKSVGWAYALDRQSGAAPSTVPPGGHESHRHPGRQVATQGQYLVTDMFNETTEILAYRIDALILAAIGEG
jgi:hypothetical protein